MVVVVVVTVQQSHS